LPLKKDLKLRREEEKREGETLSLIYIYRGPTRVVLPELVSGRTRTISAGEGRESKINNRGRGVELEVY
jgi:hypothetical protein